MSSMNPSQAYQHLSRNTVDLLPEDGLSHLLTKGRQLRVKLGIDPTAPDIHFGHVVVLRKLREFQELGHKVVLIIGDYTARVGDPSGRSATRPVLTSEEIDRNAETFQQQAACVLSTDKDLLEVRWNSEWLEMSTEHFFKVVATTTVAQLLERDDFAKRYAKRAPISMLEMIYPILQGYDSVAIKADIEVGGTDQKFNLLLGRDLQKAFGQPQQTVMTLPILAGLDGQMKMSKSLGNHIGVTEEPNEIYGKTLSIPDSSIDQWSDLLLGGHLTTDLSPRDAKHELASRLIAHFYDADTARSAADHFQKVFIAKDVPEEIPTASFTAETIHLPALIAETFGESRSQARRLIQQGAVKLDGKVIPESKLDFTNSELDQAVLQVGRRRFCRLISA